MLYNYDIIVIGSGSGGLTVALGLAAAGKKVALIERGKIGGDCTNFGCVPSKALIDIAKSGKYTMQKAMVEMRKRRQVIQDEETPDKIEAHGLKVIAGFASFKDQHTIYIDGKVEVTAKNIVISTGSHAQMLQIPGVKTEDILTSETIFEVTEDIKDLIVVGGGYIGCELAEAFQNLGVQVTIIQRNDRLIPREETASSKLLQELFESKGIRILTKSNVTEAKDKMLSIQDQYGKVQKLRYDKILVALGRETNIKGLELNRAGILSDKGILVDAYSRTSTKNIFAIGDCVDGNPQFTHLANNEGRGVVRNILVPFWKNSVRDAILPAVLYTTVEIARVGKTKEELLEYMTQNEFRTEVMYFKNNDRSRLTEDTTGFIMIHFKRVTGVILGATILGSKAGEMLPILVSAMQNNISAYKLSKLIFPYPTKAELIKKICDKFVISTLSHAKVEAKFLLKEYTLQIGTGFLWLLLVGIFFYYKQHNALSNLDVAKDLYRFLSTNYWGPVIYILVYAIRPIVLFPATLLTFMSGALFGVWGGFLYTMVGENLSANFAYVIGRVFGKKIIPDGSRGVLNNLKSRFEKDSFIPVLMTRFLFFPFDLVNYGAGILKAHWSGFFWGTFIGIIPGALVFIIAGSSIQNVESFDISKIHFNITNLAISAVIFVLSLAFAKGLKKWEKKKNEHN